MARQRFELVEGKSSKFWEVDVKGTDLLLRWGRIGTNGQSKTKTFPNAARAKGERDKLIAQKTKKGYSAAGKRAPKKRPKKSKTAAKKASRAGSRQLPMVLRDPPWLLERSDPSGAEVTLDLTPLPHADEMAWRPGQQQEWKIAGWGYGVKPTPGGAKAARKEIAGIKRKMAKGKKKGSMYLWDLLRADDAELGELFNQTTPNMFENVQFGLLKQVMGRSGLDGVEGALTWGTKSPAQGAELLSRARTPRVAPLMARALGHKNGAARRVARGWLAGFPEAAAIGLIPLALGADQGTRTEATAALRHLQVKGHAHHVTEVAKKYGRAAAQAVDHLLDYDPLLDVPRKVPSLPKWFAAAELPRPRLRGGKRELPVEAVEHLATMLAFSAVDPPYAGIALVKEACDPDSLFDFAWELFSLWLASDGKTKTDWAMMALAHFGGDEAARRLTPLLRRWPTESQGVRAARGFDVLAAIGTDVALMHLHGLSQRLRFKGLKAKALEKIEQISEARGLTAEELADRLVPDLDLNESGTRDLDFGTRVLTVGFDDQLTPFVRDADGHRLDDLPKPAKSDDEKLAKEAAKTWKALKKDARVIGRSQIARLERAMCTGRRWDAAVFLTFFVDHPLMQHLTRRVLWGIYGKNGKVTNTFRVTEDGTLANRRDDELGLKPGATVGIPHPLALSEKIRTGWGEVFDDYQLLQPFEQLSRHTAEPTAREIESRALCRVSGALVPTGRIRGVESRGWEKGAWQDSGGIHEMLKPLPGGTHHAVLPFEPGIHLDGSSADEPEQKLGDVVIQKLGTWDEKHRMKLGELDPIMFSELVREIEELTLDS